MAESHLNSVALSENFLYRRNVRCSVGCLQNKLLTSSALAKKGMDGPSKCTLCYNHVENADHLFLNYKFSKIIGNLIQNDWNKIQMSDNIHDLWTEWRKCHRLIKFHKASDILVASTC